MQMPLHNVKGYDIIKPKKSSSAFIMYSKENGLMIRVLVWNEYYHEKKKVHIAAIYPNGIHGAIAEFLG